MGGLITMQCGPIRYAITAAPAEPRSFVVRGTTFTSDETGADGPSVQAIYSELAADRDRTALIFDQVTEFRLHCAGVLGSTPAAEQVVGQRDVLLVPAGPVASPVDRRST